MGDVIDFKTKEIQKDFSQSNYEVDRLTVEWENLGLSYCGTLQIDYLLKCLENLAYDDED